MTTFDERERAFETKFAHDEEMKFRAETRANRLLGLWAAGRLGLTGDDAEGYAVDVMKADLEKGDHAAVLRKVSADLAPGLDSAAVRAQRESLLHEAKRQIAEDF